MCSLFSQHLWRCCATVSNRKDSEVAIGRIDVRSLERIDGLLLEAGKVYAMVESTSAYYEAYSHVLKCLQREEMEQLPFSRNIIDLEPQVNVNPAKPQTQLTMAGVFGSTSEVADGFHRRTQSIIHDSARTLVFSNGERTERRPTWRKISGSQHMPTRSDNLLPAPLWSPRVWCQLAGNAWVRDHIRHGHPGCAPPPKTSHTCRTTMTKWSHYLCKSMTTSSHQEYNT